VDWRTTADFKVPGPVGAADAGIALLLKAERLRGYYWIKVIAPLVLIVAMSWAVFWIDPKDTGTKISITITAMLTLIAFRFAIGTNLPAISYLTRMDVLILLSTILVYASLVAVLTTAAYSRKGNHERAKRIDRISRWGFPLFFIASGVVSMGLPT
jgi:nitric oxide reductase large subunit